MKNLLIICRFYLVVMGVLGRPRNTKGVFRRKPKSNIFTNNKVARKEQQTNDKTTKQQNNKVRTPTNM